MPTRQLLQHGSLSVCLISCVLAKKSQDVRRSHITWACSRSVTWHQVTSDELWDSRRSVWASPAGPDSGLDIHPKLATADTALKNRTLYLKPFLCLPTGLVIVYCVLSLPYSHCLYAECAGYRDANVNKLLSWVFPGIQMTGVINMHLVVVSSCLEVWQTQQNKPQQSQLRVYLFTCSLPELRYPNQPGKSFYSWKMIFL